MSASQDNFSNSNIMPYYHAIITTKRYMSIIFILLITYGTSQKDKAQTFRLAGFRLVNFSYKSSKVSS
jgi:hypothetical protein